MNLNLRVLNQHLINDVKKTNSAAMLKFIHLLNYVLEEDNKIETEEKTKCLYELIDMLKISFDSFDFNKYVFNQSIDKVINIEKENVEALNKLFPNKNNKSNQNHQVEKTNKQKNKEVKKEVKANKDHDTTKEEPINMAKSEVNEAIEEADSISEYYNISNYDKIQSTTERNKFSICFLDVSTINQINDKYTPENPINIANTDDAFSYLLFNVEQKIFTREDIDRLIKEYNLETRQYETVDESDEELFIDNLKINHYVVDLNYCYLVIC